MAADIHAHAGDDTLMGPAEPVLNLCGGHGDERGAFSHRRLVYTS